MKWNWELDLFGQPQSVYSILIPTVRGKFSLIVYLLLFQFPPSLIYKSLINLQEAINL